MQRNGTGCPSSKAAIIDKLFASVCKRTRIYTAPIGSSDPIFGAFSLYSVLNGQRRVALAFRMTPNFYAVLALLAHLSGG